MEEPGMNPNQINAAIAEALGWKPIHRGWMCSKDGGKSAWLFGDDKWELQKAVRDLSESDSRFGSEVIQDFYPPPDYTSDLNAMAAAVGSLACHDHRGDFARHLQQIVCGLAAPDPHEDDFWCYNATAAQRAEAFLRTLGKWEDGE